MKVFRIWYVIDRSPSVRNPHCFLMLNTDGLKPEQVGLYKWERFTFTGQPKDEASWNPPPMELMQPLRPAPDIWYLVGNSGAFGVGPKACDCLYSFLTRAGQLLPLTFREHQLQVCNVLESAECVDEERSEWYLDSSTNQRRNIRRPFFEPNKLPGSTLFKIPQMPTEIFVWEETGEPEDEFKACVEANKLTGLIFEPVWSEEEGIILPKPTR